MTVDLNTPDVRYRISVLLHDHFEQLVGPHAVNVAVGAMYVLMNDESANPGGSAEVDEPAEPAPRPKLSPAAQAFWDEYATLRAEAEVNGVRFYHGDREPCLCSSCATSAQQKAAAAPVSVAGDDTQPDGPHLVDAAAPAMREVLRRVELGQLSSASAVDILLDWPSRALAEAGAPAQPDATDETRIEWGVEYSDEGDVDEPISTEEAARSEAVAVLRRFPDQVTSAVVVTRTVRTITTPWQPVDNPVGAALAGAADTEEPTDA